MTQKMIEALEAKGFKRWQKGSYDRLYAEATVLGLKVERYNTGNIFSAEFQGEKISNSEARRVLATKTYIDVTTGKVYSGYDRLGQAAIKIMKEVEE